MRVSRERLNNLVRLALITVAESFYRRALILSRPIALLVLICCGYNNEVFRNRLESKFIG